MGVDYFFDSYALVEIVKGNPSFIGYANAPIFITLFNLVEVVNSVFLDYGEQKASETHERFKACVQEIDWKIIKEAIQLKQKYKKRNVSYADCIGYAFANQHGLRFLTGDKEFRDLPNVEFVK